MKALGDKGGFGSVFVFQAVLNDLELQFAYRPHHLSVARVHDKQLCHTLIGQLLDALFQLLGLHRVVVLKLLKNLGRKARNALELQVFALGQGVADFEVPGVVEARPHHRDRPRPRPLWPKP